MSKKYKLIIMQLYLLILFFVPFRYMLTSLARMATPPLQWAVYPFIGVHKHKTFYRGGGHK